ncbi:MAG TPA: hypothetical protein VF707_00630, partial [Ardenticatenaceae bacterium]
MSKYGFGDGGQRGMEVERRRQEEEEKQREEEEKWRQAEYTRRFGSSVERVSTERGDEGGRDAFLVAAEFADGEIAREVLLVNAFEGAEEIANIGPQTF